MRFLPFITTRLCVTLGLIVSLAAIAIAHLGVELAFLVRCFAGAGETRPLVAFATQVSLLATAFAVTATTATSTTASTASAAIATRTSVLRGAIATLEIRGGGSVAPATSPVGVELGAAAAFGLAAACCSPAFALTLTLCLAFRIALRIALARRLLVALCFSLRLSLRLSLRARAAVAVRRRASRPCSR